MVVVRGLRLSATLPGVTALQERLGAVSRHSAFRYVVTGVVSAAADFGLLFALHGWLRAPLPVATFVAVALAFLLNYAMNRIWSFGSTARVGPEFSRYLILAGTNWVLTAVMVSVFTWAGLYYLLAKAVTLVLTTAYNYLLYRVWVFAGRRRPAPAED